MNKSLKIKELIAANRHFYNKEYYNEERIIEQANKDFEIIKKFLNKYNENEGPRVGDFLEINNREYVRISYHWGDRIQTGSPVDSYHLGDGYVSYSGGLNDCIPLTFFEPLNTSKEGRIWIFSNNWVGAHRGVYLMVPFRCYTIKKDQDTLQEIKTIIDRDRLPEKHPLLSWDPDSPQFKSLLTEYYLLRATDNRTNPLIKDADIHY